MVKLIRAEPQSAAFLRWYVETERVLMSRIGVIETVRVASRREHDPSHRERLLREIEVLELTSDIAHRVGDIGPAWLRTLDAIHLASALQVLPALDAFVTYDDRLAAAARSLGLPVVRPA
jgi:predicted nucleic acid-binding protein